MHVRRQLDLADGTRARVCAGDDWIALDRHHTEPWIFHDMCSAKSVSGVQIPQG
jgi:hypothetical protein